MWKPVLFMRKKSTIGSFYGNHSGVSGLSKSVGDAVALNIIVTAAKFDFGVGTDAVTSFGFNTGAGFGSMSPALFNDHLVDDFVTDSVSKQTLLLFGATGTTQIENTTTIKLFLSGYNGNVDIVWNGAQLRYEVVDTAFSDYIVASNGTTLTLTMQPL